MLGGEGPTDESREEQQQRVERGEGVMRKEGGNGLGWAYSGESSDQLCQMLQLVRLWEGLWSADLLWPEGVLLRSGPASGQVLQVTLPQVRCSLFLPVLHNLKVTRLT